MESHIDRYEFIELRVYDIHGYTKGRLLTRSAFSKILDAGAGINGSVCFRGINAQIPSHRMFGKDVGFKNIRLKPLLETLRPCMKIVQGDHRIGSVLCELRFEDGTLDTSSPREATLALLEQLHSEFGLKIKSSFEAEFGVRDPRTNEPFINNIKWGSLAITQLSQALMLGMVKSVDEIGVKIDTLMAELGEGQFEVTFDVAEGIKAADMTADFKTGSTVYMKKKGFNAEFMTCVNPKAGLCNGFHHNFSLWDGEGWNLFADAKNPGQFSEFGRHWLAGMIEHAPALTAFSSPTINCYRRSKHPVSPKYADWAYEDRGVTFRVKTEPSGNAYIENRLPSSACSPHLVLAYTLAAGMDGVRRKLPLPQPRDKSEKLPQTLEEALGALEADTLLKAALGPKLVELFIYTKRVFEVDEFKALGDLTDEEILLKEKEYYYEYC